MKKRRQLSPEQIYKRIVFCDEIEMIIHNNNFESLPRPRTIGNYIWKYKLKNREHEAWIEEMAQEYKKIKEWKDNDLS